MDQYDINPELLDRINDFRTNILFPQTKHLNNSVNDLASIKEFINELNDIIIFLDTQHDIPSYLPLDLNLFQIKTKLQLFTNLKNELQTRECTLTKLNNAFFPLIDMRVNLFYAPNPKAYVNYLLSLE